MQDVCIICLDYDIIDDDVNITPNKIFCNTCNGFSIHNGCLELLLSKNPMNNKHLCPICRGKFITISDEIHLDIDNCRDTSSHSSSDTSLNSSEIEYIHNTTITIINRPRRNYQNMEQPNSEGCNIISGMCLFILWIIFTWFISSILLAIYCSIIADCDPKLAFYNTIEKELFKLIVANLVVTLIYVCVKR